MIIYRLFSSLSSLYIREGVQQETSTSVKVVDCQEPSNNADTLDEESTQIAPSIVLDTPEDELDPILTIPLRESPPSSVSASPTYGKRWTRWTKRATKAMSPYQSLQNLKLTLQVVKRGSFSSFDRKGSITPSDVDSPMEEPSLSPMFLRHRHLIESIQNNNNSRRTRRPVSYDFSSDPPTSASISSPDLSKWGPPNITRMCENGSISDEVPIFYGWAAYCGRFQTPRLVSPTYWDDIVQRQRDKRLMEIEKELENLGDSTNSQQSEEAILVANESGKTLKQCYSSWTIVPDNTMIQDTRETILDPP